MFGGGKYTDLYGRQPAIECGSDGYPAWSRGGRLLPTLRAYSVVVVQWKSGEDAIFPFTNGRALLSKGRYPVATSRVRELRNFKIRYGGSPAALRDG